MRAIVELATSASDEELLMLADALADSGDRFEKDPLAADVPSTGGPSSLSTLLCPLFLRVQGFRVPKIGVEGRPAGAIDVLGCIPGYAWDIDLERACSILDRTGYVHLWAGRFAPLDGRLFAFRKSHGAIASGPLAIASLLSKKIAAGVTHVTLDVRVAPHGNFGDDFGVARENAERFNRIASMAGIHSRCILTDAQQPYQPFIGRGEALVALQQIFDSNPDPWLSGHLALCWRLADMSGTSMPTVSQLQAVFADNLRAQGSSWEAFIGRARQVSQARSWQIRASASGFPTVELETLRAALVGVQSIDRSTAFPDPVGVTLEYMPGRPVVFGDRVANVRSEEPALADAIETQCFSYIESAYSPPVSVDVP